MKDLSKNKVIIIGSGIAGIASSIRLAAAGFQVEVFEANSYPGGKLSEIHVGKYRFDAGPSLFTLPVLVEELFTLCDENPKEKFPYKPLDLVCTYHFESGKIFKAYSNPQKLASEAELVLNEPKENILKRLKKAKTIWDLTADMFIFSSLHRFGTYANENIWKRLFGLGKLGLFETMHQSNLNDFKTAEAVQIFDRYATYNGSNPFKVPATLNIINHVEYGIGAFIPEKGMIQITNELVALAERKGVVFHLNSPVEKIITEGNSATGVVSNNQEFKANIVISNCDAALTYRKLLNDENNAQKILKQERSSSALVFNWGIKREFPELSLHNIFFSKDYKVEFEALFHTKTVIDDPTVYIFIGSKEIAGDAPAGCENWFTMINVPENIGQDWDEIIERSRKNIIHKLSRLLKCNIEDFIECEEILDPRDIERKTSSLGGSLYGTSSNTAMAAFFRQANFSSDVKNLYFCGGSVHPGGGIPMCLASAKITSEIIEKRFS